MSVKIRLQRHGKKQKPFYWVVAADARSKRDGKYLEKIGTYNPNTNPATIELNLDSAVKWLHNGAQPTDTAKAILSYKGALLKHHLDGGIRKGALTQEQADAKLAAWLEAKSGKVDAKKEGLTKAQAADKAKAFKAEQDVNAKRLATAAQAEADAIAAATPAVEEEAAEVEAAAEEVVVEETPATEVETANEVETVIEEVIVTEEATPVAEVETATEEVTEEAPATEKTPEA
ncbi:30S ribosomal protein S16 [Flavobacterium franklandianum]|uniref:Small ribosomal subunit protein bS16 n=4 Tax=Pseudomonadati TaxID=3379134 RepID=A0A553CLB2_9FLAO|nr:30S ribosomal protein S16 [Flavobacterium franklandianum]TRX21333.1 30S ribosomal protein S16 [Flavobacterium franklandianum]